MPGGGRDRNLLNCSWRNASVQNKKWSGLFFNFHQKLFSLIVRKMNHTPSMLRISPTLYCKLLMSRFEIDHFNHFKLPLPANVDLFLPCKGAFPLKSTVRHTLGSFVGDIKHLERYTHPCLMFSILALAQMLRVLSLEPFWLNNDAFVTQRALSTM